MTNHLVYSLDFDGCTDTPAARLHLTNFIVEQTKNVRNVRTLRYLVGSLRQFLELDVLNGQLNAPHHNGIEYSCTLLKDELLPQLQYQLAGSSIAVEFDPFLAGDLYDELMPGTTFNKMQEHALKREKLNPYVKNCHNKILCLLPDHNLFNPIIPNSSLLTDYTKISTLYTQMHYSAQHYRQDDTFTFVFVDDRSDILLQLHRTFGKHTQLIPRNCTLQLLELNHSGEPYPYFQCIAGRGEINFALQTSLLALRDQFGPRGTINMRDHKKINQMLQHLTRYTPTQLPEDKLSTSPHSPSMLHKFFNSVENEVLDYTANKLSF